MIVGGQTNSKARASTIIDYHGPFDLDLSYNLYDLEKEGNI